LQQLVSDGMNILLLYPEIPATFWSFKYALKFISKRSSHPPLGLLTVASMLPQHWHKKLVDLNVSKLKDRDIAWADYVYISAMSIQRKSVQEIIGRCQALKTRIVAGGPLFTEEPEQFQHVEHLILNEAEITLPKYLHDLSIGKPQHTYSTEAFPEIKENVLPDYSLLDMKKYASMSIQFSRGCPFNCEFCEITGLFGKKVRLKSADQIINELENLYQSRWNGDVFFVDDNFIGNRYFLKKELLPAVIDWMKARNYPFAFYTEVSINLADDEELLNLMVSAGFKSVFVGIETPSEEGLVECSKHQNKNRDLLDSVREIQNRGIQVMAGFIVGFDSDTPSIFSRQIEFIQQSGIVSAMVGLLNAPRKTRLYERLVSENRIIEDMTGDNTDFSMNFLPKMNKEELLKGYQNILNGIYSCKPYYDRVKQFLTHFERNKNISNKLKFNQIKALIRSIFILGIFKKGRRYYWRLMFWSLFNKPHALSLAVTFSIFGYHYRRVFNIR
jgi:radical SAM superfamily enzyme YgiQ (UPF0313 family)